MPLPTGCLSEPGPRRPRAAGTFDGASGRAVTDQSLRPLQPHRTRQSLICQAVESQAGASARAEGTTSAGCPPRHKRASSPEGTGSPSLSFNLAEEPRLSVTCSVELLRGQVSQVLPSRRHFLCRLKRHLVREVRGSVASSGPGPPLPLPALLVLAVERRPPRNADGATFPLWFCRATRRPRKPPCLHGAVMSKLVTGQICSSRVKSPQREVTVPAGIPKTD